MFDVREWRSWHIHSRKRPCAHVEFKVWCMKTSPSPRTLSHIKPQHPTPSQWPVCVIKRTGDILAFRLQSAESKNSSQHNQAKKAHKNGYDSTSTFDTHARQSAANDILRVYGHELLLTQGLFAHSIKKPKTHRYPSLKGTDPKFRRNHRHALHGSMRALVRWMAQ